MNQEFWTMLEELVRQSDVVIDRPKGSAHPRFPDTIYPVDYGYLQNTTSMDGEGIDVWVGTAPEQTVDAIVCVVDAWKRDSEMKILIGCTQQEKELIEEFHNRSQYMKGILISRERT